MKNLFKINDLNCLLAAASITLCAWLLPATGHAQIQYQSATQAGSSAGSSGITFVAAGTYNGTNNGINTRNGCGAGTNTISPPTPAGATGEFLIALVVSGDSTTLTPSAGWNTLFADNPVTNLTSRIYWRFANGTATDNLTVTKTGTGCNVMTGQVSRFRGVDPATPFDHVQPIPGANCTAGGTRVYCSYQNASAVTSGNVTTTTANAMTIFTGFVTDDSVFDATGSGFTQAFGSITTQGNDVSIALNYRQETTAGTIGPFSFSKNLGSDPNHGVLFALKPDPTVGGLTINRPAGTTSGDVLIASIALRPCSLTNGGACTVTVIPPTGWTQVGTTIDQTGGAGTGGFGNRLAVYQRVIPTPIGSEPTSYTWTFGGTPLHAGVVGGITRFSGVDNASPIVAQAGQATPSAVSHTTPSISTGTLGNTMLVSSFAANSAATWTPPAGTTEVVDVPSETVPNDLGLSLEMNYEARPAAGATGTRTATQSTPPANDTGTTHILALRPAPTINHFSISHAGSGVACDVQTITITIHNALHAPVSAGSLTVNLSTTNTKGTWTGIVAGGGTLFGVGSGNGVASYTFAAGSSSVQLSFRYADLAAPSEIFGFNVSGGGFSELTGTANAGDDPSFTMAQAGFQFRNIEDNNTTILTQISGKPSNTGFNAKTVRLRAVRTDTNTGSCVGLFASQTRTVDLAAECNNPAACAARQVSINGGDIATVNDNGGAGASAYTGVSLTFNAGSEADTVITYPDAGQISLHARYDLDPAIAGFEMIGSSNLFVVRPFGLAFRGANIATPIAHSNIETSTVLAPAGDNFTMTVAAFQWAAGEDADNDGIPDASVNITDNGTVPNFAATATIAPSANLPGVALGTVSRGATCASAATVALVAGTATPTDWCYSEAGNVILTANVSNYITAGVNITGNSGLDGGGSGGYVGRFRPKRFAVSGASRTNRTVAACAPSSGFTYMDEGLTLAFTLTAQNTQGGTTQNYTGTSYARHDPTTAANYGIAARNVTPFKDLTAGSRITSAYVTAAPVWLNGVLNVTGSNAARVTVGRPTPDDPPDGPYAQVQFGIAPTEPDGVLMAAYDLDIDNNAVNDHTAVAPVTELRYGRMRIGGVSGSQLLPLRVPVEAQYWNGTFWVTNVDDNCTTLVAGNVGLGNYIGGLTAGSTTPAITASPLQAGRTAISLSAPGVGKNGSVDVALNLGAGASANACPAFAPTATAGNKPYLRGKWCDATATRDPVARARFGIRGGGDEAIYLRENY